MKLFLALAVQRLRRFHYFFIRLQVKSDVGVLFPMAVASSCEAVCDPK